MDHSADIHVDMASYRQSNESQCWITDFTVPI